MSPTGKFWRQRFGEKRKGVFYSKAAQSGRMACSCLKVYPLQSTQRKTQPPPAKPVQDCTQSSFSHSKYRHSGIAGHHCIIIQADQLLSLLLSGLRLLPGVCMWGQCTMLPLTLPMLGVWGCCQLLQWVMQGLLCAGPQGPVPSTWPCAFQGWRVLQSTGLHIHADGSQRKR